MKCFMLNSKRIIQLSLRDITSQKLADISLKNSKERFSKAFQSSPAPIAITDIETGCIIDVNDQWQRLTGYSREEILGKTTLEIGVWHDVKLRDKIVSLLRLEGHIREMYVQVVTKSGDIRDMLWSAEIIKHNETESLLTLGYDYTEEKKAEEEKERLQSQLLQAQKMESIGRLAYDWLTIITIC